MPGLSGLEVEKELARIGDSLPIVIITAFDDPESRAQCLAAGATAYLLKPFDDQALLDAIANAIESSSTLDGD
jgi:FixJ family two-component response regulator